jgi:D-alanine--poly(phosphoribitol) ligase subunit 2
MKNIESSEIRGIVMDYIRKEYLEDEDVIVDYDTPLISSGFIDSFSMVSLLVFLENRFEIRIPPHKATSDAFNTVNNIVDLVTQFINLESKTEPGIN